MTRSRRHYHQLHQHHEQSSTTWSIGLATCRLPTRLPIGERTSWGRAISHKAITVNCFLQARGGTGHSDRDTHRISSGAGQEEAVHNKWRSRSIGGSSSSAWRHATSIFVQRMLQGVRASTTTWDEDEDEAGDDEAVWTRIGSCICKMLIAPGRPVAAASASASPSLATATRVRLWRIRHA